MSGPNVTGAVSAMLDVVRELEKERGSRIWCMVHQGSHICYPSRWHVFDQRKAIGTGNKIEILLHTGGGHPELAYQIMKFFRRRFKVVNIIVPLFSKSSATLMCLGADEIYMGEMAELGPIDIQLEDRVEHGAKSFSPLDEFKSFEFLREQALEWMAYYATITHRRYGTPYKDAVKDSVPLVSSLLRPIFEQIDPVQMGGYRRAIAIAEEYAGRMLALTGNPLAKEIVKQTVWGYPSHDFCIDRDEAGLLGLPVKPLPQEQDEKLSEAIASIEGDDYHGFAPAQAPRPQADAATSAEPSAKRGKPLRQNSSKPGRAPRVNGTGRNGGAEIGGGT